jgi:hypothetical protein
LFPARHCAADIGRCPSDTCGPRAQPQPFAQGGSQLLPDRLPHALTLEGAEGHCHVATRRARADDKGYGPSCGRGDLAPRAHRGGAENAV